MSPIEGSLYPVQFSGDDQWMDSKDGFLDERVCCLANTINGEEDRGHISYPLIAGRLGKEGYSAWQKNRGNNIGTLGRYVLHMN